MPSCRASIRSTRFRRPALARDPTLLRELHMDQRLAFPLAMLGVPTLYTALRLMKPSVRASRR